jgi:WD40 repeat protein
MPRIMVVDKKYFEDRNQEQYLENFNSSEKNEMLFAKVIRINNIDYIANGLYGGFKLWSIDGKRIFFQIPAKNKIEGRIYAFTSICEFNTDNSKNEFDCFLCGDNYGQIFIVSGEKFRWKSKHIYGINNKETILSISSYIDYNCVGVCIDNGNVLILKVEKDKSDKLKEFNNEKNISLVSSIIKNDYKDYYLGCGFVNGEIKIYNMNKLTLSYTINSHLRGINTLIGVNSCFISGAEDGAINIWKVGNKKIELRNNLVFEDKNIVGITYDEDKRCIYANAYDYQEIIRISNLNIFD